ncbi:MAG TPA: VC0807 family protein [Acetobacteraceae bacterium]|nr:VC0807 family protein [Acetobacteraceae bacterium]
MNIKKILSYVPEYAVNLVMPWLVYTLAHPYWGDTGALIASAMPPVLWSIYELIRFRRVDALSLLIVSGIVLSLAALMFGGSPRVLMLRENLVTFPVGFAFLLSAFFRRPLIYYLARATMVRQADEGLADFERIMDRPPVTRAFRIMSLVWGAGLCVQAAILSWMAWTWPIPRFLIVSPIVGYGIFGALGFWTYLYQKRGRKRAERAGLLAPEAPAAPQSGGQTTLL